MPVTPGAEDAAVGVELLHEAVVGLHDGPALPDVGQRVFHAPALLLHQVGHHRRRRARHAHLAVHQHRLTTLPAR